MVPISLLEALFLAFRCAILRVRLSEVVIPCGGAARWLEQKYPTQDCPLRNWCCCADFCFSLTTLLPEDDLMGFAAWLDERFPASDS